MSETRIIQTLLNNNSVDEKKAVALISASDFMDSIFTQVLGGTDLESDQQAESNQALIDIASRDILRYLERSVQPIARHGYDRALDVALRALLESRNPDFIRSISTYIYAIFHAMSNALVKGQVFADGEEEKIRILIGCIASVIPFLEPPDDTRIHIPLKINNQWRDIEYRATRIDISPCRGLLARLLEEEDRMYDYILTPNDDEDPAVPNIVSLMGTSPDMVKGSDLAVLENYRPYHSLGEGHNLAAIENAMRRNPRQNYIVGHSKGANMGMIITAKFPELVLRADCLNPAGLSANTLKRYAHVPSATWSKVNVYHQLGDPVFSLEQGLPPGINLYGIIDPHFEKSIAQYSRIALPNWRILNPLQNLCNWFTDGIQTRADIHLRYLVAHRGAKVIPLDVEAENHSRGREFRNDIKETMNKIFFVKKYWELCTEILARKAVRKLNMSKMVKMSQTFPLNIITKMNGIVETMVFTTVILLPAILLTVGYSGLKIFGKSLFTNCYQYPASTLAPPINEQTLPPEPKKWHRTELPTNGDFSKKLEQAKQQQSTVSLTTSPFSLWLQDLEVFPQQLSTETTSNNTLSKTL